MSPRGGKRVGAGRPKGRSVPAMISVRVEQETLDGLKRAAATRGISLPEFVRSALSRLAGGRRKQRPRRKEKRRLS
jgi:hypothetical protein